MVHMDRLPVKKISCAAVTLGLLYFVMYAEAKSSMGLVDCCLTHFKKTIPVVAIRSFTIQRSNQVCGIDAIIFSTKKGQKVCTNPKDAWVKRAMRILRKKKKKKKN